MLLSRGGNYHLPAVGPDGSGEQFCAVSVWREVKQHYPDPAIKRGGAVALGRQPDWFAADGESARGYQL